MLCTVLRLLSHLSFDKLYALSDLLFYPLYHIVRYRRKVVRKNLSEVFPDKSLDEIIALEKRFYHSFFDMIVEACKMQQMTAEEMREHVRFTNIDKVNAMLAEGRSVAAYIGHYANWEWISSIGLWLYKGAECAQIYHQLSNRSMDRLMTKIRERWGNRCVEMHSTARYVHKAAQTDTPQIIGFIADQAPLISEIRHYTRFLNHTVPVLTGTERLVKRYDYAAMYIRMKRIKRGYYECEFVTLHEDSKSLPDYELTELYFKCLEEHIMSEPELYLWSHNRFKNAVQEWWDLR